MYHINSYLIFYEVKNLMSRDQNKISNVINYYAALKFIKQVRTYGRFKNNFIFFFYVPFKSKTVTDYRIGTLLMDGFIRISFNGLLNNIGDDIVLRQ